jgi:hypothetical protein
MMDDTTRLAPPPDLALEEPARLFEFLAGGLVLAIASFAVVVYAAYHGWYAHDLSRDWAYAGIGYGFVFYAVGVFIFSYGWHAGDIVKALRLSFFICAATLVLIVALVMLLKARADAAAKGAGAVASATKADFDGAALLHTAGSMLIPGDEAEAQSKQLPRQAGPFQILCDNCGLSFAPAPPSARCPHCQTTALTHTWGV